MSKVIIECKEAYWDPEKDDFFPDMIRNPPKRLVDFGIQRIVGKSIRGCMTNWGSYGMGGPGFLAIGFSDWTEEDFELLQDKVD